MKNSNTKKGGVTSSCKLEFYIFLLLKSRIPLVVFRVHASSLRRSVAHASCFSSYQLTQRAFRWPTHPTAEPSVLPAARSLRQVFAITGKNRFNGRQETSRSETIRMVWHNAVYPHLNVQDNGCLSHLCDCIGSSFFCWNYYLVRNEA